MEAVTLRGVDRGSWHIIVGIDGEVDYSIKWGGISGQIERLYIKRREYWM